jgi:hypothetical protein
MWGKRIRLLGVTASGFGIREQLGLFEAGDERQRRVVRPPTVRERFGPGDPRAPAPTGIPAPFEREPGTAVERRRHEGAGANPARPHRIKAVTDKVARNRRRMRSTSEQGLTSNARSI